MKLRKLLGIICITVGALALMAQTTAEAFDNMGQGQAIVTVLPLENKAAPENISKDHLQVKVNGKETGIVSWTPFRGLNSDLELVILIDDSAQAGIGLQVDDIAGFIQNLPDRVKVAVGYMNAGRAVLGKPLSTDRSQAVEELRIPAGVAGSNASPYFCLSDLAQNWPSDDLRARREVILITDGVDNYYPGYSSENPYLKASISDSIRANLVVYSIYMPNRGQSDKSGYMIDAGQSALTDVTSATGGYTYWDGSDRNPVSLNPYLDDIAQRLQNQYQLRFQSRIKGNSELQSMSLKVAYDGVEVFAPQRVNVSFPDSE